MIPSKEKKVLSCLLLIAILSAPGLAKAQSEVNALSVPSGNNYLTHADLRFLSQGNLTSGGSLPRGTQVTVIETKEDVRLGTLLHLGVDSDDQSLPSDVWVSMKDAVASGLDQQAESDLLEIASEDSDSGFFMDARGVVRRKMTYCYRYVKQYMMKVGLVRTYLPGASAWMAAGILPKMGFKRIAGGPQNARINDICVYRGGNQGNGHVEIRTAGGWFYGYGTKPNPITRVNHPFLGCFRK